jgi:solute:Na+ symporter, SSS family
MPFFIHANLARHVMWAATFMTIVAFSALDAAPILQWDELAPLPPAPRETVQAGLAGPYAGEHNGALLVAGGANFPGKPPWEGGVKAWWNNIWVYAPDATGRVGWIADERFRLPRSIGYGVSFSTPDGVVCVGGADNERCYREVFLLRWDPLRREVITQTLPSLPEPLAFGGGAMIGTRLFVVAGQQAIKEPLFTGRMWCLDVARRGQADFAWEEFPAIPGAARMLPVVASQTQDGRESLFVFSGRTPRVGQAADLLSDGYRYDVGARRWTQLKNVRFKDGTGSDSAVCLMGAVAIPHGSSELLVFGGDRGKLFKELEQHDLAVAKLRSDLARAGADRIDLAAAIDQHLAAKRKIYENHPGFSDDVLLYNLQSDSWRRIAKMPVTGPVTTSIVPYGDAWVIPSGEERPGIRTTRMLRVKVSVQALPTGSGGGERGGGPLK